MPAEPTELKGLRRKLTKELFEELGALQCTTEEILGYIGTTEQKLDCWCRKTYRRPLDEMMPMIRQDTAQVRRGKKACIQMISVPDHQFIQEIRCLLHLFSIQQAECDGTYIFCLPG